MANADTLTPWNNTYQLKKKRFIPMDEFPGERPAWVEDESVGKLHCVITVRHPLDLVHHTS